jgi:hemolysin-activating ACP:hemolysin acyltransferase
VKPVTDIIPTPNMEKAALGQIRILFKKSWVLKRQHIAKPWRDILPTMKVTNK